MGFGVTERWATWHGYGQKSYYHVHRLGLGPAGNNEKRASRHWSFLFFFLFYTVGRSIRSTAFYFSAALWFLNGSNGDGSFFYYLLYLFACHSCNSYGVY